MGLLALFDLRNKYMSTIQESQEVMWEYRRDDAGDGNGGFNCEFLNCTTFSLPSAPSSWEIQVLQQEHTANTNHSRRVNRQRPTCDFEHEQ
jgi:hypothetical protein